MMISMTDRKTLFQQVALIQLKVRATGVLRGSATGDVVCPLFLADVAIITEAILKNSEEFQNVRTITKDAVEAIVKTHTNLLAQLVDKPDNRENTT